MKINKVAVAGSMESNDAFVAVYPKDDKGIEIEIVSILKDQFGNKILSCVEEVVNAFGIDAAVIKVNDKGALDYVIRARVETALLRAAGGIQE